MYRGFAHIPELMSFQQDIHMLVKIEQRLATPVNTISLIGGYSAENNKNAHSGVNACRPSERLR